MAKRREDKVEDGELLREDTEINRRLLDGISRLPRIVDGLKLIIMSMYSVLGEL